MKKLLLSAILFSSVCFGQVYVVQKTTALTASAEVITVQQPATGARQVNFIAAYFDCSSACSFTLERNGTAASSTSLAVRNVNPGETVAATTAFSASNVGTGTVLGAYNCPNSCSVSIDLTGIVFSQVNGTGANLTLRSNSITATVDITFKYSEKTL